MIEISARDQDFLLLAHRQQYLRPRPLRDAYRAPGPPIFVAAQPGSIAPVRGENEFVRTYGVRSTFMSFHRVCVVSKKIKAGENGADPPTLTDSLCGGIG